MTFTKLILLMVCLTSAPLIAQEAKLTELMSKDLTTLSGQKEGLMVTVEYRRAVLLQSIATMHTDLFMCWRGQS